MINNVCYALHMGFMLHSTVHRFFCLLSALCFYNKWLLVLSTVCGAGGGKEDGGRRAESSLILLTGALLQGESYGR